MQHNASIVTGRRPSEQEWGIAVHHPQLASGERPKGDDYGLAAVVRVNVALPGKGSVELDAGASELCQPGMLQPLHWQHVSETSCRCGSLPSADC